MGLSHEELYQHLDTIYEKYGEQYYDTDTITEILLSEGLSYSNDRGILTCIEAIFKRHDIEFTRPPRHSSGTKSLLITGAGVAVICSANVHKTKVVQWLRNILRRPEVTGAILISNHWISLPDQIEGKSAVAINPF